MVVKAERPFQISHVGRDKGTIRDEPALIGFSAPVPTCRLAEVTREAAVLNRASWNIHPPIVDEHLQVRALEPVMSWTALSAVTATPARPVGQV
jgi:hypothetical protein